MCRHFEPLQPLGTTENVYEIISTGEVQPWRHSWLRLTGDGNEFDPAGRPVLHDHTGPLGEHDDVSGCVEHIGQRVAGPVEGQHLQSRSALTKVLSRVPIWNDRLEADATGTVAAPRKAYPFWVRLTHSHRADAGVD